ncbi:MAG: flagellar type III secretion system pore protein FliP [bacterium]
MTLGAYTGVALALGLVLILLGLSLKLLQKLAPGSTRGRVRIPMEVVQRLSIGPKQGVAIVRIGERLLVVSIGDGGMRRLTELGDEEAAIIAESAASQAAISSKPGVDFRAALSGALKTAGFGGALILAMLVSAGRQAEAQAVPATLQRNATTATNTGATAPVAQTLQRNGITPAAVAAALQSLQRPVAPQGKVPAAAATSAAQQVIGKGGVPAPQAAKAAVAQAAPVATAAGADLAVSKLAPQMDLRVGGESANGGLRLSGTVGIVVMMGLLTLLPTLLLMMTSFTRILIVLHFLRQALGTQNAPPAQLVAAIALLLTGFVMAPTLTRVNADALQPWMNGKIEQGEMMSRGAVPFREFMLRQTRDHDLQVFVDLSKGPRPATAADVPLVTVMSAFVTSELRTAFQIGFALFLPFIIIDVVVSSVLMSMGMFMLPPAMISLPFKLLLFVLVDGWTLIVQSLVASFK